MTISGQHIKDTCPNLNGGIPRFVVLGQERRRIPLCMLSFTDCYKSILDQFAAFPTNTIIKCIGKRTLRCVTVYSPIRDVLML